MHKHKLFLAATITLFVFPLIASLVGTFSTSFSYYEMFPSVWSLLNWGVGLGYGLVISVIAVLVLRLPQFKDLTHQYQVLFAGAKIGWGDIVFYALCAGIGEEIFFRGMLQDFLGIWPTAILFVALHGYFSIKSKPKLIYAILLTLFSAGFGYLDVYFGIYAAMIAHAFYDVVMFWLLLKSKR